MRKNEILRYIECLHAEIKVPIVYVTHAVEEIVRLADVVVLMAGGKVIATGKPTEVMGRTELRAPTGIFEGGTLIEARVVSHDLHYDLTTLEFSGGALTGPVSMLCQASPSDCACAPRRFDCVAASAGREPVNVLPGRVATLAAGTGSSCDLPAGRRRRQSRGTHYAVVGGPLKLAVAPSSTL